MKKFAAIITLSILAASAWAHSGGTDGAGCHTDHKTGGYHCHR